MAPRYCRASTFGNDQASYKGLTIVNGMGKQAGMSDGSGQTAWSYNAIGSVLTERRTILGVTNAISYNYNPDGSPASPRVSQQSHGHVHDQQCTAADCGGRCSKQHSIRNRCQLCPPGDCKECSVAGGALVGYFIGGALANAIKSPASRGRSFARDVANRYIPGQPA